MKTVTTLDGIQFKLLKNGCIEIDTDPLPLPYSAKRTDIGKAIRSRRNKFTPFKIGQQAIGIGAPVSVRKNCIQIGCQKFEGENFQKLKAWALAR